MKEKLEKIANKLNTENTNSVVATIQDSEDKKEIFVNIDATPMDVAMVIDSIFSQHSEVRTAYVMLKTQQNTTDESDDEFETFDGVLN